MSRTVARRIGAVSYLNARPLIEGLEESPEVKLLLDVPARLLGALRDGRVEVALLPVIDYQAMDELCIVPAGGIGCDGETLTVRILSRVPMEEIRTLAVDAESHTSVALARIIFQRRYGRVPELAVLEPGKPSDAVLLIGDKVVCAAPQGFRHQMDLGQAWKELTGMPFVFAAWTARAEADLGNLPQRLEQALRRGLANVDEIVRVHATPRGWPADVARTYLTKNLQFQVGAAQLRAMERFFALAAEQGIIAAPPKALRVYGQG